MHEFINGAVAMGYAVICLIFMRLWSKTRDRLFFLFGLAFLLLSANRVVRSVMLDDNEMSLAPHLIRLLAFVVILLAIVDKNVHRK